MEAMKNIFKAVIAFILSIFKAGVEEKVGESGIAADILDLAGRIKGLALITKRETQDIISDILDGVDDIVEIGKHNELEIPTGIPTPHIVDDGSDVYAELKEKAAKLLKSTNTTKTTLGYVLKTKTK
jgi:hypothetical protein